MGPQYHYKYLRNHKRYTLVCIDGPMQGHEEKREAEHRWTYAYRGSRYEGHVTTSPIFSDGTGEYRYALGARISRYRFQYRYVGPYAPYSGEGPERSDFGNCCC